jgi:hypothetical protein
MPERWPADFPDRFCLFLLDGVGDSGEVIALDANGNKSAGRASRSGTGSPWMQHHPEHDMDRRPPAASGFTT